MFGVDLGWRRSIGVTAVHSHVQQLLANCVCLLFGECIGAVQSFIPDNGCLLPPKNDTRRMVRVNQNNSMLEIELKLTIKLFKADGKLQI